MRFSPISILHPAESLFFALLFLYHRHVSSLGDVDLVVALIDLLGPTGARSVRFRAGGTDLSEICDPVGIVITSAFADESVPIVESGDEMVLGPPGAANE